MEIRGGDFMAESEKKEKPKLVGFVLIEGRYLRVDVLGADGETVEEHYFAFLGDVSALILGMRKADYVNLYEWVDLRKKT